MHLSPSFGARALPGYRFIAAGFQIVRSASLECYKSTGLSNALKMGNKYVFCSGRCQKRGKCVLPMVVATLTQSSKSKWVDGTTWSRVDVGAPGVSLASAVAAMCISAAEEFLALRPRVDQVG